MRKFLTLLLLLAGTPALAQSPTFSSLVVGNPTGGNEGAGTLNVAALYIDGQQQGGGAQGVVSQGAGSSENPWYWEGLGTFGAPSGGVVSIQGSQNGSPVNITASTLPLPSGAATATLQNSILASINALTIENTAFGISGTLPNFATPPTVNLGTIGGAATQTTLAQILTLQPALNGDGGAAAHVTNFPTTQAVTGTFWQATQPTSEATLDATVTGGTVKVTCISGCSGGGSGSNASVGSTGAAVPAAATLLGLPNGSGNLTAPVLNTDGGIPSHITNFPATQPVSAATLPLPGGAATSALQSAEITALGSPLQAGGAVTVSNLPATQAISATTLPLPTGAATAANQAAPGTAGTPSSQVLTVQGAPGGTGLNVVCTSGCSASSNPSIGTNGATAPTSSAQVGYPNASGNLTSPALNADGGIPSHVANFPATQSTYTPDIRNVGTTLNAATLNATDVFLLNNGVGAVGFTVNGVTASGATLALEGTNDGGTTWGNVNSVSAGTGILSSTITADGQFSATGAGRTALRLRVSVAGTGTITISNNESVATRDVALAAPLPPGANHLGSTTIDSPLPGFASTPTVNLGTGSGIGVTGTFWPYAINGDGGVPSHVTNFPTTQAVSGSVGITGTLPAYASTPTFIATPQAGTYTRAGCTVTTTAASCIGASTVVNHVLLENVSSAVISCAWGGTAAIANNGSFTMTPYMAMNWGANTGGVPSGALSCIASATGSALYVEYN